MGATHTVLVEAESFANTGGWKVDQQQHDDDVTHLGHQQGQRSDSDQTGTESEQDVHGLGDREREAHRGELGKGVEHRLHGFAV